MAHFDCNRGAVHVGLSAAYAPDSIWVAGDTKNKFSGRKVAVTAVAAVTAVTAITDVTDVTAVTDLKIFLESPLRQTPDLTKAVHHVPEAQHRLNRKKCRIDRIDNVSVR